MGVAGCWLGCSSLGVTVDRVSVRLSVANCTACSLHLSSSGPVPFRGPSPAKIAIVAEAPGKVEDAEKRPLVGPSGKLVSEWLARAKIDESEVAFLNAVSCYPNRTPSSQEVELCRGNMMNQLAIIQPSLMVVLGGVALSSFWSGLRMGDANGKWWTAIIPQLPSRVWSISTYHPAAVLRNSALEREVFPTIMSVKIALSVGRPANPHPDSKCIMCGDWADVWRLMDGTDVTNSTDCEGALAWCQKHDGLRMGTAGRGREKKESKAGSGGSVRSPRTKGSRSTKPSTVEMGANQTSLNIDKYRVK